MFEKFLDTFERIATALERIAAYAGNPTVKVTHNSTAAEAGKADKPAADKAADKPTPTPRKATKAEPADDGLGGDTATATTITFETMREKLVEVKMHEKLGKTKSDALLAKYGKLPDIKEASYPALVAECNKLLKSVA